MMAGSTLPWIDHSSIFMKVWNMIRLLQAVAISAALITPAGATSGPGCLTVVNVARNDVLNIRAQPSSESRIVGALIPQRHGILHLDGDCRPKSASWGSRWCPVTHYDGDGVTKGWVKARFVRDSECP
jgi:hypothetical protein